MKKNPLLFILLFTATAANAQSTGYLKEDFEKNRFPPLGWSTINLAGSNVWTHSVTAAHEGTKSALSSFNAPRGINYLIAKQFTVSAGDSVTFWFTPQFQGYPDSLFVQVSTTGTNPSNFTTTIGTFYDGNNYPAAGTWQRAALSLSAFAGQNIFVAFKHVDKDGDGIYIDDVTLGTPPGKDIKAVSIEVASLLTGGTTITPKAVFQNIGSKKHTFTVTLVTDSYSSTKKITSLAPLEYKEVKFDGFNLPSSRSTLVMTAYSSLEGDADLANDTVRKQVEVYAGFDNDGWIIAKDLPAGVFGNAVTGYYAGVKPKDTAYIFSIGGANDSKIVGTTERFNVKTQQWKKMAAMPTSRYGGSAFTYKGKIYYLGGYIHAFVPTDEVSIYDIATDTWSNGAPLPVATGDYAGCQYQDSLFYVIGGFDGFSDVKKVYVYNAGTDNWKSCTNFPGIVSDGNRAGIADRTIITVGGYSQNKGILLSQSYKGVIDPSNPRNISWTQIADYPAGPTARTGATGVQGAEPLVYFTGGFDNADANIGKTSTWAYNLEAAAWERGPDKPTGVSNISDFAPFVFRDTLYIASVGGFDGLGIVTANEWLRIGSIPDVFTDHLFSFTAALQNNKTLLNWKASEDGTGGHYIIQRSPDAVHFTDMAARTDAGVVSAERSYDGFDLSPLKGYNYYRIKIVKAAGDISYSAIKAVNNKALPGAVYACNIYPNPTHGPLNIVLQNKSGKNSMIGIAISDAAGRKIISQTKTAGASLNLNYNLKPGIYVVNIFSQDETWKQSQKVIVE